MSELTAQSSEPARSADRGSGSGRTAPPPRLVWVDRLRVWLTILVVAHHCALTYSTIPLWYFSEPGTGAPAVALDVFVAVNQLYFMGAFFLLSGSFVPASLQRRGAGGFARERLLRLGVPLLAFVVVIRPLTELPAILARAGRSSATSVLRQAVLSGDAGPTWFLEVLLVCSLGYALWLRLRGRGTPSSGSAEAAPDTRRPPFWGFLALIAVMAAVTAAWRLLVPDGTYWPIVGLPTPSYLPQYVLMFAVGIVAGRRGWLRTLPGWWAAPAAVAALIGLVISLEALAADPQGGDGHRAWAALGMALLSVGATTLLVLIFRRWLNGSSGSFGRFLSAQAFVVYLIHPLVLVWWAWALHGITAPADVRALILFVCAAPTCWLLAGALRRIPIVRRIA